MKDFLLRFFSRGSLAFLKLDLYFLSLRLRNLFGNPSQLKPAARFLNVGCGLVGVRSAEWFNIDGFSAPGVDYACDLRRRLPSSDGRFEGVYSEHFFEHLYTDDARRFLRECHRVLRRNGVLRISVPDGERYVRSYVTDRGWLDKQLSQREWLTVDLPSQRTPMAMVNEVFRQQYEHQYCYDFETLALLLSEAGFADVTRVDFGAGALPELQIDRPTRKDESLYIEGRKP